jgi:hypothetical protein
MGSVAPRDPVPHDCYCRRSAHWCAPNFTRGVRAPLLSGETARNMLPMRGRRSQPFACFAPARTSENIHYPQPHASASSAAASSAIEALLCAVVRQSTRLDPAITTLSDWEAAAKTCELKAPRDERERFDPPAGGGPESASNKRGLQIAHWRADSSVCVARRSNNARPRKCARAAIDAAGQNAPSLRNRRSPQPAPLLSPYNVSPRSATRKWRDASTRFLSDHGGAQPALMEYTRPKKAASREQYLRHQR